MKKTRLPQRFNLKNSLRPLLAILPVFTTGTALATSATWTGSAGDDDFFNQNNWSPSSDPATQNDLLIKGSGGNTINLIFDSTNSQIGSGGGTTIIGSGSGNTAKVDILLDASKISNPTINDELIVGTSGGTGILDYTFISDPTQPEAKRGIKTQKFSLGQGSNSIGQANIFGSGKTISEQTMDNGELITGQLEVASGGGKGTLNLNGASIDLDNMTSNPNPGQPAFLLGSGANSIGEVNLLGGGKIGTSISYTTYTTPTAIIGLNEGYGSLLISGTTQKNGETVRSRAYFGQGLLIGDGNKSIGSIRVEDGGLLATFAPRTPGLEHLAAQLGVNGGTGSVLVSGSDSQWQISGETPSANSTGSPGTVGQLHIGVSGTGEVTVSNDGKVSVGKTEYSNVTTPSGGYGYNPVFDNSDLGNIYLADTTNSTGILNIGAAAGSAAANTGIIEAKEIIFGAGQGALVFNHTDTSGTYIFDIGLTGNGLTDIGLTSSATGKGEIKNIAGVTTLNTNQSSFTGTSNISGGTFLVNNILGGTVNVSGNGTLAGNGTVGSTTLQSGGTISPGTFNSTTPMTLTVNGDLIMNAGSKYHVNVLADTSLPGTYVSDLIQVIGNATLGGNVFAHVAGDQTLYIAGSRWKIVSATGTLSGVFSGTPISTRRAYINFEYDYDAQNAYLIITRSSPTFCLAGMTQNQCSVSSNIDTLDSNSELYNIVSNQPADSVNQAMDQLSGEIHASAKGAALEDSRFLREAVNNRLRNNTTQPSYGAWGHTFGSWGKMDGNGNADDLQRDIGGVFFGADAPLNDNWQTGFVGGYSNANIKAQERHSKVKRDDYHLGAYIGYHNGPLTLRTGLGYSWHDYASTRNIDILFLKENLNGKYRGNTAQLFAEGGYKIELKPSLSVEPFINGAYVQHNTRDFTEKGGLAALHSNKDKTNVFTSTVGARLNHEFDLSGGQKANVFGQAGWKHTFNHTDNYSNFNFANGSDFRIQGTPLNKNVVALEVGAQLQLTPTLKAGIMYNGQISSKTQDHGGKAYLEWAF